MSITPQPPDWPPPQSPEPPAGDQLPPDFETHMPDDLEVKHCYRHSDRETGVSCANCGRPICHECMIPAAVGFRCPECVREQRVGGSRARVVTRGQIRGRWGAGGAVTGRGAPVTRALVAINAIVFLVELVTGYSTLFGGSRAGSTVDLGGLAPFQVLQQHEYWRMFTRHVPAQRHPAHRPQHVGVVGDRQLPGEGDRPRKVPRGVLRGRLCRVRCSSSWWRLWT